MGLATGGSNLNLTDQKNFGINEAKGAGVGGPAVNATGRDDLGSDFAASLGASINTADQFQENYNYTDQEGGNAVVAGSDNATSVNVV
jgi:hypothetical protein